MKKYYTEGKLIATNENLTAVSSEAGLRDAFLRSSILEGVVRMCDKDHNLIIDLPCMKGIIPREEAALGIDDGSTRDIAIISRVNKPVCFKVSGIAPGENGEKVAVLSRKAAQEECLEEYISQLQSGDIIPAVVTHLEQFGSFVDIGCGIPSLIPIDAISVSRISHPSDRFCVGDNINVIIKSVEGRRVCLSHKELLGTWEENASLFHVGETVSGIIRSVESYGEFIELAPNLAGLAEPREGVFVGQSASVFIKAIIPEKMKVKLIIVDVFEAPSKRIPPKYFIDGPEIKQWVYSPPQSLKTVVSEF